MNFDNEKQRQAARDFLKRLSRSPLNNQQARNFMENYTDYSDPRSYKSFLKRMSNSDTLPIEKSGGEFRRTDMGGRFLS